MVWYILALVVLFITFMTIILFAYWKRSKRRRLEVRRAQQIVADRQRLLAPNMEGSSPAGAFAPDAPVGIPPPRRLEEYKGEATE